MPDWITHMIVCWLFYQLLIKLDYLSYDPQIEMLMVFGSILPDLNRLYLIGNLVQPFLTFYSLEQSLLFFLVFHTPIGVVLAAGAIALFFDEKKEIFLYLVGGVSTHLALDSLLTSFNGGISFFFPLDFTPIQFDLIHSLDMSYMILALGAFMTILIYRWWKRKEREGE